jgi:hypothetical protein
MALFKRPEYTKDEIKLHIKRLERETKELKNKYNTALLREKEMFSNPHTIKDIALCHHEYGYPKDIKFDIEHCKRSIMIYKDMLKTT